MVRFATIRQEIADTCRILADHGYFAGTGGNIGVRLDERLMAVTPSATDYYTIGAVDVPIIDIATRKVVDGHTTPTVEKSLHACMIEAFPSRRASIHTHQPVASACTLLGKPMEVPDPALWDCLGKHIPLVGYAPSGSSWLAGKFGRAIRWDYNAYLMRNHGVLCCGPDVQTTLLRLESLETFCRDYLLRQITEQSRHQSQSPAAVARLVDALMRSNAADAHISSEIPS